MWLVCNKCGKKVNVKKSWEYDICYECFETKPNPNENVEDTIELTHENVYMVKKNAWIGNNHYSKGELVEYDSILENLGII